VLEYQYPIQDEHVCSGILKIVEARLKHMKRNFESFLKGTMVVLSLDSSKTGSQRVSKNRIRSRVTRKLAQINVENRFPPLQRFQLLDDDEDEDWAFETSRESDSDRSYSY
jgi:hypothetical protein